MNEPRWLTLARQDVGLKEIQGSAHEQRILNDFAKTSNEWVKDDETAWCAAWLAARLIDAGRRDLLPPGPAVNRLRALEFLNVGLPTPVPEVGDLAVFSRDGGGHVGFFLEEKNGKVWILSGNDDNSVRIGSRGKSSLRGYRHLPRTASDYAFGGAKGPTEVDVPPVDAPPNDAPVVVGGVAMGSGVAVAAAAQFGWTGSLIVLSLLAIGLFFYLRRNKKEK